uniref:Low affinity sulfate transporter 3-like n=1 Tax=Tanacetum cinerariifolium TaxID=118510 RepID=A0A699IEC3_TANCI|nr:low affinity sulfate transporter 3-like [Tanacetum cinerariifolium]
MSTPVTISSTTARRRDRPPNKDTKTVPKMVIYCTVTWSISILKATFSDVSKLQQLRLVVTAEEAGEKAIDNNNIRTNLLPHAFRRYMHWFLIVSPTLILTRTLKLNGSMSDINYVGILLALEETNKKLLSGGIKLAIASPRWQVIHKIKVTKFVDKVGRDCIFVTFNEAVDSFVGPKFNEHDNGYVKSTHHVFLMIMNQENLIGHGMLGSVYRAQLPNRKLLTVKKLDQRSMVKDY